LKERLLHRSQPETALLSLKLLPITETLLNAIAALASIGLSKSPQNG
jgi:hypothetical protein